MSSPEAGSRAPNRSSAPPRLRWGLVVLLGFALPVALPGQARTADSASVAAILAAARGANPVMCALAARTVEQQGGWNGPGMEGRGPRDPLVRAALIAVHQDHVPAASVPILASGLADDDACVRRIAAPLLGRVDHPSALAALRSALRDERPATREAAAIGLGYTDNAAVIPALLAGIQDSVAAVRAACAVALGSISDHRATGALTRLLREDRDDGVRAAAAWAIGNIEG